MGTYAPSFYGTQMNKTLRNTFMLLALTMVPTVFGAWAGVQVGLPAIMAASPWVSFFGALAIMFGLIYAVHATSRSAMGLVMLGGFTTFVGAILSGVITAALSMSNGWELIATAFAGTGAILVGCSLYAMTTKRDFSKLGGFLFGALLAVIAVSLLNVLFFELGALSIAIAAVCLVLFSVYLIYDVQRVVTGGETNYVLATLAIYLDIVNIFSSLLQLLMAFNNDN